MVDYSAGDISTKEAREIIMSYAVLGEMLLNRAETVWAGNILMAQYIPDVVKMIAESKTIEYVGNKKGEETYVRTDDYITEKIWSLKKRQSTGICCLV